jgi:hypothetical protein
MKINDAANGFRNRNSEPSSFSLKKDKLTPGECY